MPEFKNFLISVTRVRESTKKKKIKNYCKKIEKEADREREGESERECHVQKNAAK